MVALVTGGAKRMGRAMVLALADAGYQVAIHYNQSQEDAENLAKEVNGMAFQADLSNPKQVNNLIPRVQEKMGKVITLINNAACFYRDELDNVTEDSFYNHMNTNLFAPLMLMQGFQKYAKKGVIINILDERVGKLTPHFTSYTLSKMGLHTLTQTGAMSLAPDIRVNAIAPGFTLPASNQSQEHFNDRVAKTPLGKQVDLQEITHAMLYLLNAKNVTGQILYVDSGGHL